jgi:hypothetical protein
MATYIQEVKTEATLKELYPTDDGTKVVIDNPRVLAAVEDYLAMQEMESEAAKAKADAKRVIMAEMGFHAEATIGAYKVTWKAFEKAEFVTKASVQRPVRVKKTSTPD